MKVTDYKYKKVLAGIIFFISLFVSERLNAQMAFHLAGPVVYRENLRQESIKAEKMKKISKSDHLTILKNSEIDHSNRRNVEKRVNDQKSKQESKQNKSDQIIRSDTAQRIRLAELKRNYIIFERKTIN